MANLKGSIREGYSNPKGGIKLTQPISNDPRVKGEQAKIALLQQQHNELKDINGKLTKDQGALTGLVKRY